MGVTGTWPELPERALNIICISISHVRVESIWIIVIPPPLGMYMDVLLDYSQNAGNTIITTTCSTHTLSYQVKPHNVMQYCCIMLFSLTMLCLKQRFHWIHQKLKLRGTVCCRVPPGPVTLMNQLRPIILAQRSMVSCHTGGILLQWVHAYTYCRVKGFLRGSNIL